MHTQPGQPRRGGGRRVGAERPGAVPPASVPDERAETLREDLESLRLRVEGAASWLKTTSQYVRLLNREGFVPVTAKFTVEDLAFLANAREELLRFTELGLRLPGPPPPHEGKPVPHAR